MKKIVQIGILSGKGGVGKTSIIASLGIIAQKDPEIQASLMDCDVDAPNLAILFPPLNGNDIETNEISGTLKSTLIEDKCIQCESCVNDKYCEFDAISWKDELSMPKIDYLACEGCGACKVLCPEHAFSIDPVKSGEIISYMSRFQLPLTYGKTVLGSTTSGKLVSDVKESIKKIENYSELDLILIDGPPGIGCPVIATVSGLDYVIAITEPTPSGLHDLQRVIEVIESFQIPFGIVINKADLKSPFQSKFENFISETKYDVLGRINYSEDIPIAMSHAQPVIVENPNSEASIALVQIFKNLKEQIFNLKN